MAHPSRPSSYIVEITSGAEFQFTPIRDPAAVLDNVTVYRCQHLPCLAYFFIVKWKSANSPTQRCPTVLNLAVLKT